jgi:outer membrane protein assembly factor BamB
MFFALTAAFPVAIRSLAQQQPEIFNFVKAGDLAGVKQYIRRGGNVNVRDADGATPLLYAVAIGSKPIVRDLLAAKADPNIATRQAFTPLHVAARVGDAILVKELLAAGALPDSEDEKGQTPLYLAQQEKRAEAIALLEKAIADLPKLAPDADPRSGITKLEEWGQWRGPNRNGVAPNSPPLVSSWPKAGPKLLWKTTVDGRNDNGSGCPVIANGKVYLYLNSRNPEGGSAIYSDRLVCLDAQNGSQLWMKEFPSERPYYAASGTPSVAGGRVYFNGNSYLYCLDANSGDHIWKSRLSPRVVNSSPLVIDGVVVVVAGKIHGFDAKTGAALWSIQSPGPQTYGPSMETTSPVVWRHEGKSYVICCTGPVFCIRPKSGRILWQSAGIGFNDGGSPTIVDDTLLVGWCADRSRVPTNAQMKAFKLSLQGIKQMWSMPSDDGHSSPLIYKGRVFSIGGWKDKADSFSMIHCVDLESGQIAWEQRLPYQQCSSPVAADGKIFLFLERGRKIAVLNADAASYQELGSVCEQRVSQWDGISSFAISGGLLYARTRQETLSCFDLRASSSN